MGREVSENSNIEWTDHTFNPWIGCTKVSPGCEHCYAETLMDTRYGRVKWGKGQPRQRTSAANWKLPVKWNRDWANYNWPYSHGGKGPTTRRPRVFCASLADWLDEEAPIEWLADLLGLIYATPHLDWLLLTKRPQNFCERLSLAYSAPGMGAGRQETDWIWHWANVYGCVPTNVWIGTTVEDQERADQRIPHMLKIPARVRFLSCEPLLERVDLKFDLERLVGPDESVRERAGIHWVIAGGESGANARPMHADWARSLRDQCTAIGKAFFFKQWGEYLGGARVGKKLAGRLLDGQEWNQFPEVPR